MTTTAQPIPNLEVANTDAMDLHSDSGYDFDDGDIDIDFGPTNENQHQDDDALSLRDAGMDGEAEVHSAPGDQDDFMVDKDDLIEEDEVDHGDVEVVDAAGQPSINSPQVIQEAFQNQSNVPSTTPNAQTTAVAQNDGEDELIDYSDDEEPEPRNGGVEEHAQEEILQEGDNSVAQSTDEHQAISKPPVYNDHEQENEYQGDDAGGNDAIGENQWNEEPSTDNQDAEHGTNDHNGDDQHQGELDDRHEHSASSPQQHQSQDDEQRDNDEEAEETEAKVEGLQPSKGQLSLHPVTINYDGSELWLFKPHDSEEGEALLTDESLATQNFPYLFAACRARLGEDINSETELGFRFDNFHAMELFEDCTACAYTTLKDLLDIYLGLHAQDGEIDPESFYVTLQFRPRVLSLVNELKKAVSDQIGFSGLNAAVAAGETSFNIGHSNGNNESFEDHWDHKEQGAAGGDDDTDNKVPDSEHHVEGANTGATQDEPGSNTTSASASSRNTSAPASQGGDDEEEEEEFIDYSEDEGEADATQTGPTPAEDPSPSSSTVQGDDESYSHAEDFTNAAEPNDDQKRSPSNSSEDLVDDLDAPISTDLGNGQSYAQYGGDDEAGNYGEGFDQNYDQAFDLEAFPGQDEYQGEDSNYYNNDDNTDFNQQNDLSLTTGLDPAENDTFDQLQTEQDTEENGFGGVDDFLDLTGDTGFDTAEATSTFPEDGAEEEINYEEEGATGQAVVDVSGAEPPIVASSAGLDEGSPQGQKRPIDEVDVGLNGAGDTTDAKRPKL